MKMMNDAIIALQLNKYGALTSYDNTVNFVYDMKHVQAIQASVSLTTTERHTVPELNAPMECTGGFFDESNDIELIEIAKDDVCNVTEKTVHAYMFYCTSTEWDGVSEIDTSGDGTVENPWKDVRHALNAVSKCVMAITECCPLIYVQLNVSGVVNYTIDTAFDGKFQTILDFKGATCVFSDGITAFKGLSGVYIHNMVAEFKGYGKSGMPGNVDICNCHFRDCSFKWNTEMMFVVNANCKYIQNAIEICDVINCKFTSTYTGQSTYDCISVHQCNMIQCHANIVGYTPAIIWRLTDSYAVSCTTKAAVVARCWSCTRSVLYDCNYTAEISNLVTTLICFNIDNSSYCLYCTCDGILRSQTSDGSFTGFLSAPSSVLYNCKVNTVCYDLLSFVGYSGGICIRCDVTSSLYDPIYRVIGYTDAAVCSMCWARMHCHYNYKAEDILWDYWEESSGFTRNELCKYCFVDIKVTINIDGVLSGVGVNYQVFGFERNNCVAGCGGAWQGDTQYSLNITIDKEKDTLFYIAGCQVFDNQTVKATPKDFACVGYSSNEGINPCVDPCDYDID